MAEEFDPDAFLRSRGVKPAGQPEPTPEPKSAPPSVGPSSAEAAPTSSGEAGEEKSFLRRLVESNPNVRFAKGAARGVTRLGMDTGRLLGNMSTTLADLPGKLPESVQRGLSRAREFADEPSEGIAEGAGAIAGEYGPLLATPGVGAEAAAARLAARFFPPMFVRGGSFLPSAAHRAVRTAGRTVDAAAKGATAGAITNPDDPATGATVGAVGGAAMPAAGAAMRSQTGQWLGGHLLPSGLASIAASGLTGLPPWMTFPVIHSIRWYSSPLGRKLYQSGRWITDQSGRVIGEIPAGAAGGAASQAMQ